jgi:pectinesterase
MNSSGKLNLFCARLVISRKLRLTHLQNICFCGLALSVLLSAVSITQASTYLLDANYAGTEGAPSGSYAGVYRLITDALGSTGIPSGSSASNPNTLQIAPGTYNTAITTGVSLSNSKNNIALIGLSGNPDDVVITSTLDSSYNPGSGALGTTGSATLQLKGNNVSALGITFANSTDTPYIANIGKQAVSPSGNYATGQSQSSNSPAVALLLQGDEQAFQNCKFLGYQDTLYTKGGRAYFKNCTVSGDIDFIFANGTSVFNNSTINLDSDHSGGTITAASTDKRTSNGLVFLNSTVTNTPVHGNTVIDSQNAASSTPLPANNMYLGRPWGWQQAGGDASTVFINTVLPSAIRSAGWLTWNSQETNNTDGIGNNSNNPAKDSRYAEFNSTTDGTTPVDVSSRVAWSHQLTAGQASAYTVGNLFSYEAQYPWYGAGYPAGDASNPGTGSANPSDPNYSWPAFWGDRNITNDGTGSSVEPAAISGPTNFNPAGYTDPSWTIAGSWDAEGQLAALVPEPATFTLLGLGGISMLFLGSRRRSR